MRGCHVTYIVRPHKNKRARLRRQVRLRTIARSGYRIGYDTFKAGRDLWQLGIGYAPYSRMTPAPKEEWTNFEANILNGFLDAAEDVGKTKTLDW